jgi:segregation and condensation protein B
LTNTDSSNPPEATAGDYSTPTSAVAPPAGGLSLAARVEGLLFTSSGPVGIDQLGAALQVAGSELEAALQQLKASLSERGVRLQQFNSRVQLMTAPELAVEVERFLGLETTARLTRAALEVLSIVAYQQPVTRPFIDSVRGVNSDSALRTLLHHGLVEEAGRSEGPGRPILYITTPDFLQRFGLSSVEELPPVTLPEPPEQGEGDGMSSEEDAGEAGE